MSQINGGRRVKRVTFGVESPEPAPTATAPSASQNLEETAPSKSGLFGFFAKLATNFFNKEKKVSTEQQFVVTASLETKHLETSTQPPISPILTSSTVPPISTGPTSSPYSAQEALKIVLKNLADWLNPQDPITTNIYAPQTPQPPQPPQTTSLIPIFHTNQKKDQLPPLKFDKKIPYLILTSLIKTTPPINKFQRKVKKDIDEITEMLRDNLHEAKYAKLINGGSEEITNFTHNDAKDVLEILSKYIDKKIKAKATEKNGLQDWNPNKENIQIEIDQYNAYKNIIKNAIPKIDKGKGEIQEYYKEKQTLGNKQMRMIRQNPKDDINANWETRQKAIKKLCKNETLGGFEEIKELKKIIDEKCEKISDRKKLIKRNDSINKRYTEQGNSWGEYIARKVREVREIGG